MEMQPLFFDGFDPFLDGFVHSTSLTKDNAMAIC